MSLSEFSSQPDDSHRYGDHISPTLQTLQIASMDQITLHGEPATPEQIEVLSKWAAFWSCDAHKFFYSDGSRETTWIRPENFPMAREREVYIQSIMDQNLSSGLPPSHEIANLITEHLNDLDPMSYLGGFFHLPPEKMREIVQERCIFYFKRLLDDRLMEVEDNRRLKPTSSWEFAQKILSFDRRYNLIVRPSEKKQLFNKWKKSAAERESIMRVHQHARGVQILQTILLNHPIVNHETDYGKAMSFFGNDDFWKLIEYGSRRRAFDEAVSGIRYSIQMKEHEKRKKDIEDFENVMKLVEPKITADTSWKKAQSIFLTIKSYAKNKDLQQMNKEDALCVYMAHMKKIWSECREARKRNKQARERADRKLREGFCQLLEESRDRELIKLQSKWKDVAPFLCQDDRFLQALKQPGPVPLDYFKFFMIEWNREFKRDLLRAMELIKNYDFDMSMNTSIEVFTEFLDNTQKRRPISKINLPYVYNHLIQELVEKNVSPKEETFQSYHNIFLTELALIEKSNVVDISDEAEVKAHFNLKFQLNDGSEEVFHQLYRNFVGRNTDDEEGQIVEGEEEDAEKTTMITPSLETTNSTSPFSAPPSGSRTDEDDYHRSRRSRSAERSHKSKKSKKSHKRRHKAQPYEDRSRHRSPLPIGRDKRRKRSRSPNRRYHFDNDQNEERSRDHGRSHKRRRRHYSPRH